ncbi:hydroxymethylbilane synthase [Aquipuribacter nitratireducens]|uniref:Porphobilinogen deaminase n=1 Tax=Aquipuribacter nitratireducens TaxID=650104 RepID=A0ABW0GS72_9MICO
MIRVGTRASALARTQSGLVAAALTAATGEATELVEISTAGDTDPAPLRELARRASGVGVFVSALREALLDGRVDVAVHSLKDLPTAPAPGIVLAAVPEREDPRDVLVTRPGLGGLADLPDGARVGTGSPRRAALLREVCRRDGRHVEVVDVRGNVDTRLARVHADLDAVILAHAGLRRLGRGDEVSEVLDPAVVVPAPGQGALAVETRADDPLADRVRAALDHPPTRAAVTAERRLLAVLDTGCSAPVGAWARVEGDRLVLLGAAAPDADADADVAADADAGDVVRVEEHGGTHEAEATGERAGRRLLAARTGTAGTTRRTSTRPGPRTTEHEESLR